MKVDFPDEYLAAPLDLDNDGVMEILSTCTNDVGTLQKYACAHLKANPALYGKKKI